jgi:hypothetical protein
MHMSGESKDADDGELAQEPYRHMAGTHSSVVSFADYHGYKLRSW